MTSDSCLFAWLASVEERVVHTPCVHSSKDLDSDEIPSTFIDPSPDVCSSESDVDNNVETIHDVLRRLLRILLHHNQYIAYSASKNLTSLMRSGLLKNDAELNTSVQSVLNVAIVGDTSSTADLCVPMQHMQSRLFATQSLLNLLKTDPNSPSKLKQCSVVISVLLRSLKSLSSACIAAVRQKLNPLAFVLLRLLRRVIKLYCANEISASSATLIRESLLLVVLGVPNDVEWGQSDCRDLLYELVNICLTTVRSSHRIINETDMCLLVQTEWLRAACGTGENCRVKNVEIGGSSDRILGVCQNNDIRVRCVVLLLHILHHIQSTMYKSIKGKSPEPEPSIQNTLPLNSTTSNESGIVECPVLADDCLVEDVSTLLVVCVSAPSAYVRSLGYDETVLLDLLLSSETSFLRYLLRYVKFSGDEWKSARSRMGSEYNEVCQCLTRLTTQCISGQKRGLFPYSLAPLLRHLEPLAERWNAHPSQSDEGWTTDDSDV
eukprot:CFRG5716T1